MTERKQWGGRGEPEANNLVYTKRQKHIYAIRKHETTTNLRVKKRKQMSISYRGGKTYPDGYTFVSCRKKLGSSNAINSIKW